MSIVNRSLVPVRANAPYVDWINSLGPAGSGTSLREMSEMPSAYLVEATEDLAPERTVLPAYCAAIFETELESWWKDREAWPRHRSGEVFQEWFEVEFMDTVIDLCDDALAHEE